MPARHLVNHGHVMRCRLVVLHIPAIDKLQLHGVNEPAVEAAFKVAVAARHHASCQLRGSERYSSGSGSWAAACGKMQEGTTLQPSNLCRCSAHLPVLHQAGHQRTCVLVLLPPPALKEALQQREEDVRTRQV